MWQCPAETAFKTTADSTNRIRDKERVSRAIDYEEEGRGGIGIWSYFNISKSHSNRIQIATGYERIVYGDHGPYFEFRPDQIIWKNFPTEKLKSKLAYYDEAYSANRSIKLYLQKKTVEDRPNPPAGMWSTRNYRQGGYADYKPGMVYMSAFDARKRMVFKQESKDTGAKWPERPDSTSESASAFPAAAENKPGLDPMNTPMPNDCPDGAACNKPNDAVCRKGHAMR